MLPQYLFGYANSTLIGFSIRFWVIKACSGMLEVILLAKLAELIGGELWSIVTHNFVWYSPSGRDVVEPKCTDFPNIVDKFSSFFTGSKSFHGSNIKDMSQSCHHAKCLVIMANKKLLLLILERNFSLCKVMYFLQWQVMSKVSIEPWIESLFCQVCKISVNQIHTPCQNTCKQQCCHKAIMAQPNNDMYQ